MQLEEYFKGELSTVVLGVGVVEIQIFIAFLYMIKSFTRINLALVKIYGFFLWDALFYPLLIAMTIFGINKLVQLYLYC